MRRTRRRIFIRVDPSMRAVNVPGVPEHFFQTLREPLQVLRRGRRFQRLRLATAWADARSHTGTRPPTGPGSSSHAPRESECAAASDSDSDPRWTVQIFRSRTAGPPAASRALRAMIFPPSSSRRMGCSSARGPRDVVPTIKAQSATASASVANSFASRSTCCDLTAERASRKATSYGFTNRSSENPKLLMARAAAPMFNGFLGDTRTIRSGFT